MARFHDYHRTVIGYHGTGLAAALRIVNRIEGFRLSERDYDWLGRGIYFWEYAPKQALDFARIRQRQFQKKKDKTPEDTRRADEPLAVVACMIRLGFCLDLTEPGNVKYLKDVFDDYKTTTKIQWIWREPNCPRTPENIGNSTSRFSSTLTRCLKKPT